MYMIQDCRQKSPQMVNFSVPIEPGHLFTCSDPTLMWLYNDWYKP